MRSLAARADRFARLFAAAFTCSFISARVAASQATEASACNPALARDRVPTLRATQQRWAYLNRIDQETFELLKKDLDGGLSIPVVDLFIKPSASYGEFVDRREKFFQEINYTSDLAYEEPLLNLVTDPLTYTASAACMEQFAKRHVGFHAWKRMDRRDGIVIDYYWHPPAGVSSARAVGEITGGSVRGVSRGRAFPPGHLLVPNEKGTMESGATSANNRNVACGNATDCSPDRKWRASSIELTMDAGEGRVFRGAHVTCVGMPPY